MYLTDTIYIMATLYPGLDPMQAAGSPAVTVTPLKTRVREES